MKLWVATRVLGHREEEKFPTRYDRSSHRALAGLLEPWSEFSIVPFYRGAVYFKFSRPLMRAYLAYESALERREAKNLATHYLIVGEALTPRSQALPRPACFARAYSMNLSTSSCAR